MSGEDIIHMAHAQGILTRPSLNRVQEWALRYYLEMSRREFIEDKEAELERHLLNVDPERWNRTYGQEYQEEPEFPINNPRDLDRWVANLGNTKAMNAGEASSEPFWKVSSESDN